MNLVVAMYYTNRYTTVSFIIIIIIKYLHFLQFNIENYTAMSTFA